MTFDYQDVVDIGLTMISEFGRSIVVQRFSASATDASKPWNGTGAQTVAQQLSTVGVFLPAQGTDFGKLVTDKDLLKSVEQVVIVPATSTDLSNFNSIIDNSISWKIQWTQVLKPGNTTLIYSFGLKR
jgi:hypothetical protein